MSGVFQVDREIFSNSIWNNIAEFRVFFYILGNAVWKETGVKLGSVLINRGQYLRSYRNLREDLVYTENNAIKYYSISHIKKITDKLVLDGRIKKEETELGTLFTIVNYSLYQGFDRFNIDSQEQCENGERTEQEQNKNNKKKDNKDNITTTIENEPEVSNDYFVADIDADSIQQDNSLVGPVGADPTKQDKPLMELESFYLREVRKRTSCSSADLKDMVHAYETYKDLEFIKGVLLSATNENIKRNGKCKINSFSYFFPILEDEWERINTIKTGGKTNGESRSHIKHTPKETTRFTEEDAERAGVISL